MKNNSLLFAIALGASGLFAACSPAQSTEEAPLPEKEMTIQLYSIRDVIGDSTLYAQNHDSIFAALHEMGYTGTEAANYNNGKFYGVTPEQYKADQLKAGLTALSSHTGHQLTADEIKNHDFTAAMEWWDKAIADHKAAGMTYIVTPWAPLPTSMDEAKVFVDYHNAIGEKVAAAGMKYGYHTHSHEYENIPGTDIVWIEYLVENTKPENMFWQMDTYHAVRVGKSPVEYIKKYPGRFAMLHLKDLRELGQSGMLNLEPIFGVADVAGLKDYVVEQEGTGGDHSTLDAAGMNADYLRSAPYVEVSYNK